MRRRFPRLGLCLLAAALAAGLAAAPAAAQGRSSAAAAAAARDFYRYHFSSGHDFTRAAVERRRRWLDPELYRLLTRELERAEEFSRANPDETPFFTGDPFTDSQSFPTRYSVGRAVGGRGTVRVPVTFTWSERSERGRDRRAVTLEMVRGGGRWLIRDVLDSRGESLRALLGRAEYQP